MMLHWWRKALKQSFRDSTLAGRKSRCRTRLQVERFEDRVVPANTYLWTGATSTNWTDAGNWTAVGGATGTYPGDGVDGSGDVAQFLGTGALPSATVNAALSIGEIDFGISVNVTIASDSMAGHGLTMSGAAKIVSADTLGTTPVPNAGTDDIAAPLTVATSLTVTNSAASTMALPQLDKVQLGSGASLTTSGGNNVALGTLTTNGANSIAVNTPTTLTNLASTASSDTLTMSGSNTLQISGAGTFAGTLNLTGGTLNVGNNSSLGSGTLGLSGGTLAASAANITLGNAFTLSGASLGTVLGNANGLTLSATATLPASYTITTGGPVTLSGVTYALGDTLTASGTGGLTMKGPASLSSSNTFTVNGADPVTLLTGPTTLSGPTAVSNSGTGSVTLTGAITLGSNTLTLSGGLGLSGAISGAGGLTVNGPGTVSLSGNNTYTGPTLINSGATVNAASSTALGQNSAVTVSGTLDVAPLTVSFGKGLAGTYYQNNLGFIDDPYGDPYLPLRTILGTQAFLADHNRAGTVLTTDFSGTPNAANNNGVDFNYGGGGYTPPNGFPAIVQSSNNASNITGVWTGLFMVPTTGTYTFDTSSDDGSMLFIDGNVVVSNNSYQGQNTLAGAPVMLTAGLHQMEITFYNGGSGYIMYADIVSGPGIASTENIPNAMLSPFPTFSPLQIGSLSGNGTIALAQNASQVNGGINVGGNNATTTFTGTIQSPGMSIPTAPQLGIPAFPNLTKSGTGTLIVPNPANLQLSGSTSILGGTLQLGDGTQVLGGSLSTSSILDNGTLVLNGASGSTLTYSGSISGSGGVTQVGAWTLTLGGSSSYTGPTLIPAGATVNATSTTALGNGDVTLPSGAILNVETPSVAGLGLPGTYYQNAYSVGFPNPFTQFNSIAGIAGYIASGAAGPVEGTDFSGTPNAANSSGASFTYGGNGSTPNGWPQIVPGTDTATNVIGVWTGVFEAAVAGTYAFDTVSDDGSMIFIDGNVVVNNNAYQGPTKVIGSVNLTAGPHQIEIAYYNGYGGYDFLADLVSAPGVSTSQPLPNSMLVPGGPSTLLQLGSLGGAGTINLAQSASGTNNGINVGSDNNSSTFTGQILAPGMSIPGYNQLYKSGTGTFILPSGTTLTTGIGAGTLQLGTAATPVTTAELPAGQLLDNGTLSLVLPASGTVAYAGSIIGTGGLTLSGTATLQLGAASNYTGPTFTGGSMVTYETNNALPAHSALTLGSGTLSSIIDLNGFNGSISVPVAQGTGTSNAVTNSSATASILTINGGGGTVTDNVPMTGNLSLVVAGTGTETLSAPSTYTGSTTVAGSTVILGNAAAIPSGTALAVNAPGTLDLNGHSLTVTSLTGTGGSLLTNSSATPVTVTINGTAAGPFVMGSKITGPITILSTAGASTISQLTSTSSTFSGGVTATTGVLSGYPGAFGTGQATLNGGTLDLTQPPPPVPVSGFGGMGTGWTVNKNSTTNMGQGTFPAADTFELTSNNGGEATSLWYNTQVQPTGGFTVTFTYQDLNPGNGNADGSAFVVQNDPAGTTALGGGGGALGYGSGGNGANAGGISNSIAVALNIYGGAPGGQGTQLNMNGQQQSPAYTNPGGIFAQALYSGHPINITVVYNAIAQTVVETMLDTSNMNTASITYHGVNLLSILSSANAYIGFTGGTGGLQAGQQVSNFVYTPTPPSPIYTNNFEAVAGTTSNLTVNATATGNAYPISGGLTIPTSTTVSVSADPASTANQAYSLSIGGSTILGGTLNLANNVTGTATLNLNGAVSGVGTGIGTIGGSGSVTLGTSSTYNVVLGGSGAGQFTDLSVAGSLTLNGGLLNISYANNYSPGVGQSFAILNAAGGVSGMFAEGSSITAGNATYSIAYDANDVMLTVTAVAPATHLVVQAPATAQAGIAFNITVLAEDVGNNVAGGFNGTVTLSSSAGPVLSPTSVTLTNGAATIPVTITLATTQTLTAASVGLTSGTASVAVSPGPFNKYLVSTLIGGASITAGNSFLIVAQAADAENNPITSDYSGPSSVTVSTTPASAASNFPISMAIGSNGQGFALGTLQKVGTYTVQVADATSTFTGSAPPVTVTANLADRLTFGAQPANTPTGVALPAVTVQVLDAYGNLVTTDNSDTVIVSIFSGPGSFTAGSTLTAPVAAGVATFNNLTLVVPGVYSLSALVHGKYTGPDSNSFTIAPLQVLPASFTSSPSGFSLQFNAPYLVTSTTPLLYGQGFGALGPVPSVTLTQIKDGSGHTIAPVVVEGSVVLNTATNSLTYIETDTANVYGNSLPPQLADGTYKVELTSSAAHNGFQAINSGGGFLDGLGSGTPGSGDYTTTFTVSTAGSDVLWAPATADGPKLPLAAPGANNVNVGYPIYLSDNTGAVTTVNLTFNYNPAMLMVAGASANPSLPGSSFTLDTALSSPGHAVLSYSDSGANSANLTAGNVPLGFLSATVPDSPAASPIYKGKDLLTLSALSINHGAIGAVGIGALHVVAYVGDGDGNGGYSSGDAVLITRVSLQTDSGFTAFPLIDPVILGDTDGSGFIPADAALQVNEAGVGFPTTNLPNPPIPPSAHTSPIPNNVDPTVSLPANLQVGAGGVLTVPVNIDDAHPEGSTGLNAAHLALTYDPRLFTVSAADVRLGSVLQAGSGWSVVPTIDPATGQIAIALSSSTAISSSVGGSLVTIDFHQVGRTASPSSISLVSSVNIQGQVVATVLEDAVGSFILTPAPTNGFDPRIDSVVTLPASSIAGASTPPDVAQPHETAVLDSPVVEPAPAAVAEEPSVATTLLVESGARDQLAFHVSEDPAHPAGAHASSMAASGVPMAGLVFQFANTPLVSAPLVAGQHLADQLFQTLGRAAGALDPTLASTLRNVADRILPAQSLGADSLDAANWSDLGFDPEVQNLADSLLAVRRHGRPADETIASAPARQSFAEPGVVDRIFALDEDGSVDFDGE
jgi:autotransporter-associated beta strand protein